MRIADLRKEVEELISGQDTASLIASVFPTPDWEGESDGVDSNLELSLNDEILPVKIAQTPATISPPGDEVAAAAAPSNRMNKSHADYESRVSVLR